MKRFFAIIIIILFVGALALIAYSKHWQSKPVAPPPIAHNPATVLNKPVSVDFTITSKTTVKKKFNLVVGLWNQQDPSLTNIPTRDEIKDLIFGGNGTDKNVADYFKQMSGGSVELNDAGVFGWYPADKPAAHYWADPDPTDADKDGYISGHNEKWAETILKMDKEFDFSAYDANHDGNLTPDELGVLIVIPSTVPFGTNRVVVSQEYPTVKQMVVRGVAIGMIAEYYTGTPPNFGAVAHELSHLFFNTADMYLDNKFRAGNYSLLDGSYCNCYMDPWQRLAMSKNWLNVQEPTRDGYFDLSPVNTSLTVMKIPRSGTDEFLLLEYRQNDKYQDVGVPGLLVWDILKQSTDGDWARDNIHLLRANGGIPLDDNLASYHGTDTSPATTGFIHWFDGSDSGISLTNIGSAGNTIKFKLNFTSL
jgi:M6 family metalloprotease-like protein